MRLEDVLIRDSIIESLLGTEKREVIEEMVAGLCSEVSGLNKDELLEVLLEREKLGSTGIGYGVAIPHGKMAGLDKILVSFARSKNGLDFQATDEKPVHLFFLIVAPDNSTASHLKVLSDISRILKESEFRGKLLDAGNRDDIYRIIIEADRAL
ncbi:MAG: PTS sugar transporter subunit IIA [Proteobacteria bacterium]|nr:PTS sugar transporter subunit IIA [Pseudomonadota bacterium]